jgi:hypothetical protein
MRRRPKRQSWSERREGHSAATKEEVGGQRGKREGWRSPEVVRAGCVEVEVWA